MKAFRLILRPTTKMVELNGVPCRIWEGRTPQGVPVHAYIVRVAVQEGLDASELEVVLKECARPTPVVEAIPARMIL